MDLSLLGMLSAAGGGSSSSKKASGNPVQIDGLQGGVPFNEISVSGKNLIPYPYVSGDTWISHGVTFTVNSDGTITADGTINEDEYLTYTLYSGGNLYLPVGTYTLSGLPNPDTITTAGRIVITFWDKTNSIIYNQKGGKFTFTLSEIKAIDTIYIRWYTAGTVFDNVVFKPQLELGDTATEYTPPITGRESQLNVCGKNLVKYPYSKPDIYTTKTCTFTVNSGDKSVSITATDAPVGSAIYHLKTKTDFYIPAGTYTLSGCPVGGAINKYRVDILNADSQEIACDYGDGTTFTIDHMQPVYIRIYIYGGFNPDGLVFYPQLELGDTATEYEPYHGADYTITPDSNPYTVPVDITQYDGINVLSIVDDSSPIISVNANKASEQLSKIYSTLNNKPVLIFDGDVGISNSTPATFTIPKGKSYLILVPMVYSKTSVYDVYGCMTMIDISSLSTDYREFTALGISGGNSRNTSGHIAVNDGVASVYFMNKNAGALKAYVI